MLAAVLGASRFARTWSRTKRSANSPNVSAGALASSTREDRKAFAFVRA